MKRSKMFQVRMSAEELEALEKAAAKERLPTGTWARSVLLRAAAATMLLLLASPAHALDRWTWQDSAWEGAFALELATDYSQTRWAMRRGHDWEETNPILGEYPSTPRLMTYNVSVLALHAGIAALLPSKARRVWQVMAVGFEGYHVHRNWTIGVRFSY